MPADLEDVLATAAPLLDEEPDFQRIWRRGRRLRRRRRALVGVPLVLALVAVPLVVVGARDGQTVRFTDTIDDAPPVPPVAATAPATPSPRATTPSALLDLAATVESAPTATSGRYHYLHTTEMEVRTQDGAPGHDRPEDRRSLVWEYTRQQWTAADGTVQAQQETTASAFMPGDAPKWALDGTMQPPVPSAMSGGAPAGSDGELIGVADWPHAPDELRAALGSPLDDGTDPAPAHVLGRAAMLLQTGADSELRAGLLRMLATLPGMETQTDGADRVGRRATVVSATAPFSEPLHDGEHLDGATGQRIGADRTGPLQRYEYFLDPASGRLLGWQITLLEPEPGLDVEVPFVTAHATVLADGFVESLDAAVEPADGLAPTPPDEADAPPRAQYEVTDRAAAFADAVLAAAPDGYSPLEAAEQVVTGLTAVVLRTPDDGRLHVYRQVTGPPLPGSAGGRADGSTASYHDQGDALRVIIVSASGLMTDVTLIVPGVRPTLAEDEFRALAEAIATAGAERWPDDR